MSDKVHQSVSDLAHQRVGTRIRGKWRVDKLLGTGGMGAVYEATHRNGTRVALKVLHAPLNVVADVRARFARESYVANAIGHPGVVRVIDDDETDDGCAFLVMELLEGETADAVARRLGGRLPVERVVVMADALLDVLAVAHAAGVVHRDIKPDNVFLTRDDRVKILDFGIARLEQLATVPDGNAAADFRTRTGATIGTPAFMPPEQALGRLDEVDASSDLWSVGATMHFLLTGRIVHDGKTHMEVVIAAATAEPRSIAQLAPDLPPSLVAIVDRALAFHKGDRWPDARAMQAALRGAFPEMFAAHESSPPRPQSSMGSQRPPHLAARWAEERKLATVLVCELAGFGELANELEPDAVREVANGFFGPLALEIEREGGSVLKFLGDRILSVFGVPVAHEDDPIRAVRAGIAMRERVREVSARRSVDVRLRCGISTGIVMVGSVGTGSRAMTDVMGATVNVAGRIQEAAAPGEILAHASTERLTFGAFELEARAPLEVQGVRDPVIVHSVVRESDEAPMSSARLRSASGSPFFARRAELSALEAMYETVRVDRSLRIVEITGEMGLGKGYLIRHFRSALESRRDPPCVVHASRMHGVVPFGFLGKMLRSFFAVRADDAPDEVRERITSEISHAWPADAPEGGGEAGRLLAELVAPTPAAPLLETEISSDRAQTVAAFAAWIRHLARERPVVLIVEQTSLRDRVSADVLDALTRALRREPVLLVLSTRPEPAPLLADWTTSRDVRQRIELQPFPDETMERFLDDLFYFVPDVPRATRAALIRRAEGNPELCKELVRLLVDRGAVVVDDRYVPIRWNKAATTELDLPDTIRGVLQARLDALDPLHKELLKAASIIGRTFWVGALTVLMADVSADELALALDSLRARELVRQQPTSTLSGDREYSFSTQALCDAAYALVPTQVRVEWHRAIADWLSSRGELWEGGSAQLASHLDAAGDELRARRLYLAAARQAVAVCAYSEAVGLFDRAMQLWQDETRRDERIARASALRERAAVEAKISSFDDALRSLAAAESDLQAAGIKESDPVLGWIALERGLTLKEYGRIDESIAVLSAAIAAAEQREPSLLLVRLSSARAFQRAGQGRREEAAADVARGLAVGESLHERDLAWHTAMARLHDAAGAIAFYSGDYAAAKEAFARAIELRELVGDTLGMQDSLANLGGSAYQLGDYEAAARYYERGLAAARKTRWARKEAVALSNLGQAELALGHLDAANKGLLEACRLAEDGGFVDVLADAARAAADVEIARGDADEATAQAELAVEHAVASKRRHFEAAAHATAMEAWLLRFATDGDVSSLEQARAHRDAAVEAFEGLGRQGLAESVRKKYGQGSSATMAT